MYIHEQFVRVLAVTGVPKSALTFLLEKIFLR